MYKIALKPKGTSRLLGSNTTEVISNWEERWIANNGKDWDELDRAWICQDLAWRKI